MAMLNTSDFVTTSEAAQLLDLTVDSVKKYCQLGRIKATHVGRQWLIPKSEVRRYGKERRDYNRSE